MPGLVIALLGAESSGKSTLAHALALTLRGEGHDAVVVSEWLRDFCAAAGRTPRRDEQAGIAAEQQRRIEAAAARHALVLADTTGLQTAVYSEIVFGDRSLYPAAGASHRATVARTLLTGLDLPWQADGLQRDGPQVRAPVDRLLRAQLQALGLDHRVIYGLDEARTAAARAALDGLPGLTPAAAPAWRSADEGAPFSRWRARCLECLDPACERLDHARRAAPPSG